MISDDLHEFYLVTTRFMEQELEGIKEGLAFGTFPITPETPYEYWKGQALVYRVILEEMKSRMKRLQGDNFEGDEE